MFCHKIKGPSSDIILWRWIIPITIGLSTAYSRWQSSRFY